MQNDEFDWSMETIKRSGQKGEGVVLAQEMYPEKKKNIFKKHSLIVGFQPDGNEKEIIAMNLKEVSRALLLGRTRSGKTFLMRRIMDVALQSGFSVCHLSDIKDEFKSSKDPADQKFHFMLRKGEDPKSIKIYSFRPYFYKCKLHEKLPQDNQWFQLSYKDLTTEDLIYFLKLPSDKQKNVIHKYFDKANNLKELKKLVKKSNKTPTTKNSILEPLDLLIKDGVLGDDYTNDWIEVMNNEGVPVLNIERFDEVPPLYYQMYIKILLRKIIKARREDKLKKQVLILIDEASKMVPDKKDNISKEEILKHVDTAASYGVFMIFATQTEQDLPKKLVNQCRYMFFPKTINPMDATNLLRMHVQYDYHPDHIKQISLRLRYGKYKQFLKTGERCWVMIDNMKPNPYEKITEFYPFAPLSKHMETKN